MASIYNTILSPDGDPIEGAKVEIRLIWDRSVSRVAKKPAEKTVISGIYSTLTNSSGTWTINVTEQSLIYPDSLYQIVERTGPGTITTIYYVDVPTAATPVFWVGDILATEPIPPALY